MEVAARSLKRSWMSWPVATATGENIKMIQNVSKTFQDYKTCSFRRDFRYVTEEHGFFLYAFVLLGLLKFHKIPRILRQLIWRP